VARELTAALLKLDGVHGDLLFGSEL